jgi:hypothetical protein
MTKCEQVLEYNDKMIQARHKEMTKREQVLERISELFFERSEKNDARNQSDTNAASKTKVSKTPYDLIDMILLKSNRLNITIKLHRHWIGKKIYKQKGISVYNVLKNGNLKLIKWIYNHTQDFYDHLIRNAVGYGYLDIIKFIYSIEMEGNTEYLINMATQANHLEIVKWLHENMDLGCTTEAIDYASVHGNLDIIKYIHYNVSGGDCTTKAMNFAALNGNLEVVEWLWYNKRDNCNIWRAIELAQEYPEIIKFLRQQV